MRYNATLCKEALKKNYRRKSRSVRVIVPITVTVIFLGALGRSGKRKLFVTFYNASSSLLIFNLACFSYFLEKYSVLYMASI